MRIELKVAFSITLSSSVEKIEYVQNHKSKLIKFEKSIYLIYCLNALI